VSKVGTSNSDRTLKPKAAVCRKKHKICQYIKNFFGKLDKT